MKTIFIVDDNKSNLMTAKTTLDSLYKTYALSSAQRMFQMLEKITPDLILLDVDMPEMNGFEAMKILKANEKLCTIPVIFLTARQDAEAEIHGFEIGALDFINKPFSAPVLIKRIESYTKLDTLIKESQQEVRDVQNAAVAERERVRAELDVAMQIQTSMLPCTFPAFPTRNEFDIYALTKPAKQVGGDFYDFFLIDSNTLAVVIADVSGKGVPAALFMVIAKTLIKSNAQYYRKPNKIFEIVNNLLCENNDANMFVTGIFGVLDIPSGRFTFVNAGHNPPLFRLGAKNSEFDWFRAPKNNFVLAGIKDTVYEQHEITLSAGDELFLYTDGITEAANSDHVLFGEPRLLELINNCRGKSLKEITVAIEREIDTFADGAEQADDITMLVLRYSQSS